MSNVIIKNFQNPDEVRYFEKGKFELIKLNNMLIGKATYDPGWKWSEHVSPLSKTKFCEVEHYGKVLSGSATVFLPNDYTFILREGDLFYVSNEPHDSWVIGAQKYVSLHFLGAETYATD